MLLHHAFEATCERLPAKTAIVCGAERVSYGELAARVAALAALLQRRGVERGDHRGDVVALVQRRHDHGQAQGRGRVFIARACGRCRNRLHSIFKQSQPRGTHRVDRTDPPDCRFPVTAQAMPRSR